jgi:hypothetical protein
MDKLFALPHLAKLAEENDFDEECMAYFTLVTEKLCYAVSNVKKQDVYKDYTLAPLWQQLVDWFREKHGIHIELDWGLGWGYGFIPVGTSAKLPNTYKEGTPQWSYYEALTKALEEAFELIKKK